MNAMQVLPGSCEICKQEGPRGMCAYCNRYVCQVCFHSTLDACTECVPERKVEVIQ